jgi:hypothetical protein
VAVINLAEERQYFETMSGQDAFTVIIRGTAYLDYELIKLLQVAVAEPTYLKDLGLDYSKRCALAFALGFDSSLKGAFAKVGNLRNGLAHKPTRELTAGDAKDLFNALPTDSKNQIPGLLKDRVISPKVTSFQQLDPMDQYVLMLVMLRSAIIAARHTIENGAGPS